MNNLNQPLERRVKKIIASIFNTTTGRIHWTLTTAVKGEDGRYRVNADVIGALAAGNKDSYLRHYSSGRLD